MGCAQKPYGKPSLSSWPWGYRPRIPEYEWDKTLGHELRSMVHDHKRPEPEHSVNIRGRCQW